VGIGARGSEIVIATAKRMDVPLGRLLATPGALAALEEACQHPSEFIGRHRQGDWGEVGEEDWNLNDQSVMDGSRLLSAYLTRKGVRLWVITEADRSATTILLPDEY